MARANAIVQTAIDAEAGTLTITVAGQEPLVLRVGDLSPEVAAYAALHGLKQRIVDAAALERDEMGRPASPADKWAAMAKLVTHYASGSKEWGLRAAGGEGTGGGVAGGLTLRAVAAVQGVELRVMRERLEALAEKRGTTTKALLARLAKEPAVAEKMAELRGPAKAGGDELLAELAGGGAEKGREV